MDNYFTENLETGKLNVFTTREYYIALPESDRKFISANCLFSRAQGCWISKAKTENAFRLASWLEDHGFNNTGAAGVKLSFSDHVEKEKERAVSVIAKAEAMAEKADKKSEELYKTAKTMASIIPMGQPILVGHYSEKSDRRYRDKIHNKFGKAFEEMDKAEYYRAKAKSARKDANGEKYNDPFYLEARIKECNASIRQLKRRLDGKFYANSPAEPISEKERAFYTQRLDAEVNKLNYHIACMHKIIPGYVNEPPPAGRKKSNKQRR